jgi:hypothetical protein
MDIGFIGLGNREQPIERRAGVTVGAGGKS